MLRSILHAFPSSAVFADQSLLRSPTLIHAAHSRLFCTAAAGLIADVLDILAPYDHLFRPSSDAKRHVNQLRRCIRSMDHRMVSSLHARSIKFGFDSELLVSNVLLDMYSKVGSMHSCVHLFDEMPERDLISWCTLISAYVRLGFHLDAYASFVRLCRAGRKINHFVISSVLNGCSAFGVLELGILIHGLVIKSGLGFDRFVEVGLVGMYAKCGCLDGALKMFREIPVKSLVTWNSMISGYFLEGFFIEALELCKEMCRAGFVMDYVTLRVVAAAASALEMFELCQNLHAYSTKIGFDSDSFVVAEIIKLLTKLGEVSYMGKLYSKIRRPDVYLQSLLITGYQLHGQREDAVELAEKLLNANTSLSEGALVSVVSLCLCKEEGAQVHAYFLKVGNLAGLSVNNALISMYIRSGEMVDANLAFHAMQVHDIVSWTTIMAGLVQNLQFTEALDVFYAFRKSEMQLDQHGIATIINACTGLRDVNKGKQIHCLVLKFGFDVSNFVNASVLDMYVKCGYVNSAARLFSFLLLPHSLILTNIMLAGYCGNSQPEKALDLFRWEYKSGFVPDHISYSTMLSACAAIRAKEAGEQIHACIAKRGFEFSDVIIGNALISLYVKSGCIASACKFFYTMKNWNVNSYAMLMLGYIENSKCLHALQLSNQMQHSGLPANRVSFGRILKGCADIATVDLGRQIHASIIKMGLVSDVQIENTFIGMYTKSKYKDSATGTNVKMSSREDVMPDSLITEDICDAMEEHNVEAYGLFKLEKVKEGAYHNEVLLNLHPSGDANCLMHKSSVLPNVVQKDYKLDMPHTLWDFVSKVYRIEDSSDLLEKIFICRVGLKDSTNYAYLQYEHETIKLLKPLDMNGKRLNHAIMVIFLDKSQLNRSDKRIRSMKSVKGSLAYGS